MFSGGEEEPEPAPEPEPVAPPDFIPSTGDKAADSFLEGISAPKPGKQNLDDLLAGFDI